MKKFILAIIIGALVALTLTTAAAFAVFLPKKFNTGLTRPLEPQYSENYSNFSNGVIWEDVLIKYSKFTHNAKTRMDLYENIVDYYGRKMEVCVELTNNNNNVYKKEETQTYKNNYNWAIEVNHSNSIFVANKKIFHKAAVYSVNGSVNTYDFKFDLTAS